MNPILPLPSDEPVTRETWKTLYDLAAKVRAMEPWEWMDEDQIFGVRAPEDPTTLFVSVMGALGEHRAVAIYPGAEEIANFWSMQVADSGEAIVQILFTTYHLQAAFGPKHDMDREEKALARQLNVRATDSQAWPTFRSYRPGFAPWPVDGREARWTQLALEQLLEMAPRVREDPELLESAETYLVRVPRGEAGTVEWQERYENLPAPEPNAHPALDPALMDEARSLPLSGLCVEIDAMPSLGRIGPRGKRPESPFVFLAVDTDSGFVLSAEMIGFQGRAETLWMRMPSLLAESIRRAGARPSTILLRSRRVFEALAPACAELGIEIELDSELLTLTAAYESLLDHMSRRR